MTARGTASALLVAALLAAAVARGAPPPAAGTASRAPASPAAREATRANPAEIASEARTLEEAGAYGAALERLRELRAVVPADADLELATALDEARASLFDSAWVRLGGPLLSAALADTGGPGRWRDYPFQREPFWLNGRFDGWYWYVARARAEVAIALGRWDDALAAARIAAGARPNSGKERLLLALCLAHAGNAAGARREAVRAWQLDPMLPEAHHLDGLLAWRAGDRAGARASFRRALDRDSSYRAPALALSRLLLPGLAPGPLPERLFAGIRRAAELTSRVRPKIEEYQQFDQLATLYGRPTRVVPDSLARAMGLVKPLRLYVTVLVDERGRVVSNELPWLPPGALPEPLLAGVLRDAAAWNFRPAMRLGKARASYATVEYELTP